MTKPSGWSLLAFYGLTVVVLMWLRQGVWPSLIAGAGCLGIFGWQFWQHRARGEPSPDGRGVLSQGVLAGMALTLLGAWCA
jgi:hypothetical protein